MPQTEKLSPVAMLIGHLDRQLTSPLDDADRAYLLALSIDTFIKDIKNTDPTASLQEAYPQLHNFMYLKVYPYFVTGHASAKEFLFPALQRLAAMYEKANLPTETLGFNTLLQTMVDAYNQFHLRAMITDYPSAAAATDKR